MIVKRLDTLRPFGRLTLFTLLATTCWGQSATYKIRLNFDKPLHAAVEAKLAVPDGIVFTDVPAGGYEWDAFIKNLRVVLEDGSTVPLQPAGDGRSDESPCKLLAGRCLPELRPSSWNGTSGTS